MNFDEILANDLSSLQQLLKKVSPASKVPSPLHRSSSSPLCANPSGVPSSRKSYPRSARPGTPSFSSRPSASFKSSSRLRASIRYPFLSSPGQLLSGPRLFRPFEIDQRRHRQNQDDLHYPALPRPQARRLWQPQVAFQRTLPPKLDHQPPHPLLRLRQCHNQPELRAWPRHSHFHDRGAARRLAPSASHLPRAPGYLPPRAPG